MAKYERMKKMGMPQHVIQNKMKLDGISESEMEAFFNPNAATTKGTAAPNPKLVKYEKMKKLGTPQHVIRNKMKLDGVAQDDIARFENG